MSEAEAKRLRERLNNELNRASLDQCVKCTICEQSCPVSGVTPLFSGPKFGGPQGERFRDGASVDHSIDYCSSCGTCTVACPQGVNVAEIISVARAVMRAWSFYGVGTHIFWLGLAMMTDRVEWYLALRAVALNAALWGWVIPAQRRASRAFFGGAS